MSSTLTPGLGESRLGVTNSTSGKTKPRGWVKYRLTRPNPVPKAEFRRTSPLCKRTRTKVYVPHATHCERKEKIYGLAPGTTLGLRDCAQCWLGFPHLGLCVAGWECARELGIVGRPAMPASTSLLVTCPSRARRWLVATEGIRIESWGYRSL